MRGDEGSRGRVRKTCLKDNLMEIEETSPSWDYLGDSDTIVTNEDNRFILQTRRVREKYEVDTAKARREIIANLLALGDEASKRGMSKYQPVEDRQAWSSIASTIYRTANTVMDSYDESEISERLSELEADVHNLAEKNRTVAKSG